MGSSAKLATWCFAICGNSRGRERLRLDETEKTTEKWASSSRWAPNAFQRGTLVFND